MKPSLELDTLGLAGRGGGVGNLLGLGFFFSPFALSEALMTLHPCILRFVGQSKLFLRPCWTGFVRVGDELRKPMKCKTCVHGSAAV